MIAANVLNTAMRQTLVNEAVEVRKRPRQTVALVPVSDVTSGEGKRVPVFGIDYNIGDSVRARIVYENSVHLDAMVRVWGVGFVLDKDGKETQTLTVSDT
jgi:exosome complex RNA-binding protein Csl4